MKKLMIGLLLGLAFCLAPSTYGNTTNAPNSAGYTAAPGLSGPSPSDCNAVTTAIPWTACATLLNKNIGTDSTNGTSMMYVNITATASTPATERPIITEGVPGFYGGTTTTDGNYYKNVANMNGANNPAGGVQRILPIQSASAAFLDAPTINDVICTGRTAADLNYG